MLFNSIAFLVFFPIVVIIYFLIPTLKYRNLFLLVASYYFYMNWEPVYALLLLTSTVVTFLAGLGIERYRNYRKAFLICSLIINLAILFFFKYFNWAAENVTTVMSWMGVSMHVPEFKVLLPVGISFYIFQALGYSIDVYRGDVKTEKNFFRYALFVSFFPQLVAGPVERSTNLLQQFYEKKKFMAENAISGIHLMLWGYFLKLVVADRLALYVDAVYNHIEQHSGATIALASVLFCFQLYGDFAGYSYIAIGCSKVMGFKLMDNFRRPYFFSTSIQEFWKRNHISLTSWFMDYVYYPMIGNSMKLWWWCCAIFLTFFISGFWHGASWTYVICFSIHGFYLVICSLKEKRQRKFEKKYHLKKKEWWLWLNRIVTFFLVATASIFFRANTTHDAFYGVSQILTNLQNINLLDKFHLAYGILAVLILFVGEYLVEYQKVKVTDKNMVRVYAASSCVILALILSLGVFDGGQFIYFQF